MKAVELKNISFKYNDDTCIFNNASFCVDFGEVVLVSGHSGEGKSTLISIISGIIPNVNYGEIEGDVLIQGENIKDKKLSYVCKKVGIVLQNADAQIINKYVEDEIAFACENIAMPQDNMQKQISIVCNILKLNPKDKTRTLSGGQKQRVITASTLAMGQKILILDEPLANLDKDGAKKLMDVLTSLAKRGYAVIIVEHRLDVVMPYVDKIYHVGDKTIKLIKDKEQYLLSQTKKVIYETKNVESKDIIFKLENVGYSIKGKEILKDISFDINRGSRVVLLGENGVGKTTLVRILSRLQKPTEGSVQQFIDKDFNKKLYSKKKWFKKVGIVYQNPDYQLFMPTVRKEIAFGIKDEQKIDKILNIFGLKEFENYHPQSLSEGQKRRLTIAAVAGYEPDVLVLDEPTVGQDYKVLQEMIAILNKLHEETKNTMITITHDARCAKALCDRAIILRKNGEVIVGGPDAVDKYFGN
ncbi:MAG: energy-coupling factor ABC transporter ATP-binding protein [Clostridia bacterium]|nr:energy-coupling factor ABC transporter ATP-binding protein [Clostridia bacterium]